ncbi:uncharacterized protein LOC117549698 isoform X2 [Gymnodraco acuticeps]|uniref:Uncharacterized protein LOC117549698 isoform X2 n=1 Tax=Gymnodraco acuticeps TaxID=8218 RepID=A0A6P8UK53_GYMAC|nr:uncharacterized protein LOC117549698 isoform X2 [Gymnodraco acuticeps]
MLRTHPKSGCTTCPQNHSSRTPVGKSETHCELLQTKHHSQPHAERETEASTTTRAQADDGRGYKVEHDMLNCVHSAAACLRTRPRTQMRERSLFKYMLERFLEQQLAICAALLSSEVRKTEKDLCTLTESDVTTAEEVVSALKPMKKATQYMSKEKTPTLSVIAPLQDTLIDGLKPIEGESAVIKEMKAAMSRDLQKRYIDLRATLHVCSAMDPRFKSLPFLTENQRQEVYDGLIAEAQDQPMPSELSLWSVVEEGTGKCNGSADDEGMASEEETVDDGVLFKEGESSQASSTQESKAVLSTGCPSWW